VPGVEGGTTRIMEFGYRFGDVSNGGRVSKGDKEEQP